MALLLSTGFKRGILGPSSFAMLFDGGAIAVYTGTQPASADNDAVGTLLGYYTKDGLVWAPGAPTNGISWKLVNEIVIKDPTETWICNPIASGDAGWFRIMHHSDPGGPSYTAPRIDGAINSTGVDAEMRIFNPSLSVGTAVRLDDFWYTIPPLPGG